MSFESESPIQTEDYSKVVADGIDEQKKKKRREEIFPGDCENSFNLGAKLTEEQMRLQQDIY